MVRRGVRAGVERYSIKNMEPLYAFTREVALADANRALRVMEQALEMDQLDLATPEVRSVIAGYNRDDCVSTLRLRNWLEARRTELIARGTSISRPPLEPGEESIKVYCPNVGLVIDDDLELMAVFNDAEPPEAED